MDNFYTKEQFENINSFFDNACKKKLAYGDLHNNHKPIFFIPIRIVHEETTKVKKGILRSRKEIEGVIIKAVEYRYYKTPENMVHYIDMNGWRTPKTVIDEIGEHVDNYKNLKEQLKYFGLEITKIEKECLSN